MQDCFRQHPEMYGSELEDDDDEVEEELHAREAAPASGDDTPQQTPQKAPEPAKEASQQVEQKTTAPEAKAPAPEPKAPSPESPPNSSKTKVSEPEKSGDEGGELLPKAVHDATSKNN
jgi:intermembrane space import and assembly protein 40